MEETPAVVHGLDYIINIDNGDFVRKLAAAIDSNNVHEKTERLNQLNELCHHSPEGHAKVIQIIEQLRDIKKTRYCFGWLASELTKAGSSGYRSSLLSLINSIINLSDQLDNRRRIRNELIGYRILDALKDIRKECESDGGPILTELTVFDQSREKDEEHLRGIEDVDLSSHLDVFYAIHKQVSGSPQEFQYLSILQHLLQIDTTDCLSDVIWENVDRFVTKAALVDGRTDAERLQVDAQRRLDRSVQSMANCQRDCQCVCHSTEAIDANLDMSPLSPSFRRRLESIKGSNPNQTMPAAAAAAAPPPPPPPPPPLPSALPSALGQKLSGVRQLPSTPPEPDAVIPPPPPANAPLLPRHKTPSGSTASSTLDYVDSSGGTDVCAVRLPQQQTPFPKARMKKLQWSKIPASKVVGKKNVWMTVGTVFSDYKLNFAELEELFGIAETGPNASGAADSKDVSVQLDKKKKSEEINLLDGKRSLNVNIFLRQFRISHAEIITCLTTGQGSLISPEKLRGLQKILPDQDDIEVLKAFDGDRKKLGTAEKFYIELLQLPNYKLRTDALLIREEFAQTSECIRTSIDAIILTAKDIKNNKLVLEIIFMVLMAGNFLNAGGYGGDAAGFKLNSLLKLTETNANKPGMTLLHYVVSTATQKNPKLLKLPEELKFLKEAAQYSVESLTQDIVSLRGKLKAVSDQMENADESFNHQMAAFLHDAGEEMKHLENDLKEMDDLRLQLAEYFCEEEKTFRLDDCIKTFASFVDRFQKTIQENEQKEKTANRKLRQQDKMGARILPSDPTSVSSSPVTISKTVADDSTGGGQQMSAADTRGSRLAGRGRNSASGLAQDVLPGSGSGDLSTTSSVRMRNRKGSEDGSPLRPRSLDEILCVAAEGVAAGLAGEGMAGGSEDRRLRKSAEVEKNDLFNYLLHSEDTLGEFDRMGSIRKSNRRRPKTPMQEPVVIGGSRERPIPSPSPVTTQAVGASGQLEPNHKSWRTNVEKSSPLLETDLIRTPLRHGTQVEMNTRRSVSHDASGNARDSARKSDRRISANPIIEICSEITATEIPKYTSGGEEATPSIDSTGSKQRKTSKKELKDLDYLISDLEQTGREIERNLTRDNSVALSAALRGEGDGAPQRPNQQDNRPKTVRISDSAWNQQMGLRGGEAKQAAGLPGPSDITDGSSDRSKADDLKRRIANYKSQAGASSDLSVSESKSRPRSKTSDSQGPITEDIEAVGVERSSVADEGVTSPERPDSSPETKRWGRVFERQLTTEAQQDGNSHAQNHTDATDINGHQENSAGGGGVGGGGVGGGGGGGGAVGDGSVSGMLPSKTDYLRNERRGRSATFEVDTSGVKLRQDSQRGSGTSINNQAIFSSSENVTRGGHLATGSLSSADDEGYMTMSNRSSSQTASIASFEEKSVDADNNHLQDAHQVEPSPDNACGKDALPSPSSGSTNRDHRSRAAGAAEEPEETKTGTSLFARSIDSLVLKGGELVASGSTIDIDAPPPAEEEEEEEVAPLSSAIGSSTSDVCGTDDVTDADSQSSEQIAAEASQPRKFRVTSEIRVPQQQQPIRSRPSSQTRSASVSSKPQKPSINDLTDRLSRPKKQATTAAAKTSALSSSVMSPPPPPLSKHSSSSVRPDPFVRASAGRTTMPASVFNANKKKTGGDLLDSAPVPPQRTTSIRASAASDRLSKGLPTAPSHSRRSVEPSLLAAGPAAVTARKSPNIHTGHPSVSGATDGCADEGPAVLSKSDKQRSSFIRKIVQKNPIRKAAAKEDLSGGVGGGGGIQRPSKPGMSGSSKLSK